MFNPIGIKPFDVGILLRISWLDIAQGYPLLFRPSLELFADVFRAIVTSDNGGLTSPRDHLLQRPFDS